MPHMEKNGIWRKAGKVVSNGRSRSVSTLGRFLFWKEGGELFLVGDFLVGFTAQVKSTIAKFGEKLLLSVNLVGG